MMEMIYINDRLTDDPRLKRAAVASGLDENEAFAIYTRLNIQAAQDFPDGKVPIAAITRKLPKRLRRALAEEELLVQIDDDHVGVFEWYLSDPLFATCIEDYQEYDH